MDYTRKSRGRSRNETVSKEPAGYEKNRVPIPCKVLARETEAIPSGGVRKGRRALKYHVMNRTWAPKKIYVALLARFVTKLLPGNRFFPSKVQQSMCDRDNNGFT